MHSYPLVAHTHVDTDSYIYLESSLATFWLFLGLFCVCIHWRPSLNGLNLKPDMGWFSPVFRWVQL